MKKKALIVGIDYYDNGNNLYGCVKDANNISSALERNSDGTLNFDIKLLTATSKESSITKKALKSEVTDLFSGDEHIALLYFAGHGYSDEHSGYVCTSDACYGDDGLSFDEIMNITNKSNVKNKIIILDSCFAGGVAKSSFNDHVSVLSEGTTILTACEEGQYSEEDGTGGVFTNLFVDSLYGAASNLLGEVTPSSVYSHIDRSLGSWQQRPIFKTNVKNFVSLKKTEAPVTLTDLHSLIDFFKEPDDNYQLDPSYEPDSKEPDAKNNEKFKVLQKLNRVNLVIPDGEDHMYYAAMNSKSCKLTATGVHYWNLVNNNRI